MCCARWSGLASRVGLLYSAKEILEDAHYQARGMFETVEVGGKPLKIPAIVPKLSETPGATDWPGPEIGSHNREVLKNVLGMSVAEIERLEREGVI